MKRSLHLVILVPVLLAAACESTSSVGYTDGFVKSSPVAYRFSAPPLLTDMQGKTYRVRVDGEAQQVNVASFTKNGMKCSTRTADVDVVVELGEVKQGEPGAVKIGKVYHPAFTVTVPYRIDVRQGAQQLASDGGKYENMLTFKNGYQFETREQAVAAIDVIRKLGQKGIEENARKAAREDAQQHIDQAATQLFAPREISLEVPVVRSAAGLDLEPAYQMLSKARGPEQVQQALASYEQFGTEQQKADGTPNRTANYGVACGIAAAKLMLRDLAGAWSASKAANEFEPSGQEVERIRFVIYQQEKTTGVRVIPDEDRQKIAQQENLAGALQQLFGAPAK
ncbi:MAG TPA: hypothetical protein VFZ65_18940 [Planctomycetota bacterium]|nr:hypothetical protein [Planctomycetota bacterium]